MTITKPTLEDSEDEQNNQDDSERGMVTAELAMTIPVVIAVLFLVASLGVSLVGQLRVTDAAREAARAYAMEMSDREVAELVADRAGDDASYTVRQHGRTLTVTVSAPVGGPWSILDLTAESSMTALAEAER